jgi:hypothetical protein
VLTSTVNEAPAIATAVAAAVTFRKDTIGLPPQSYVISTPTTLCARTIAGLVPSEGDPRAPIISDGLAEHLVDGGAPDEGKSGDCTLICVEIALPMSKARITTQ